MFYNNSQIACIGYGFVGKALCNSFRKKIKVLVHDVIKQDCDNYYATIEELILDQEKTEEIPIYFISVPTPMKDNGMCNLDIIDSVIANIAKFSKKTPLVVIKSTIPPKTSQNLADKYNLDICFNPEFLTEKNSFNDFENQKSILLGKTKGTNITPLENVYKLVFSDIPIIINDSTTMEYVKYMKNCFLATKVTFANVFKDLCDKSNTDYNIVKDLAGQDERILPGHLAVPGHDGYNGFGGTCFPKDINAIIYYGKEIGANVKLLESVWENNVEFRK